MNKINENEKESKENNKSNHLFNNLLLNQLNLDNINKDKKHKNNSKILLSPKSNSQRIIRKSLSVKKSKEKKVNDYKTLHFDDSNKIKRHINKNILYLRHIRNMPNVIFKKYLLGNDIILPFNTIKDMPYIPCYTLNNLNNNFSEKKSFIPFRNKIQDIPPIEYKPNKTYHIFNKKITNEKNYKTKKESSISKINNNKINLYDLIDIKNYSNKNTNSFKAHNKVTSFTQIKKNTNKKINSTKIKHMKNENNFKTLENYKNQEYEFDNKVESITYNKARQLIDNPNSFVYLMFNSIKDKKFDEDGNIKKLNLKKRFTEYKKDLNKLEQKARFELFNLKKQRAIGNEINMKGRVISTNTFFNLAFGGY